MNLRSAVGRARSLSRYGKFFGKNADSVRVAYIGWTGEDNIGDDAMYWCQSSFLGPDVSLIPVPLVGDNVVLRRFVSQKIDAVCLGGGTLIGNGHFGQALAAIQAVKPDVPYFMLGVGCESHEYREGNRQGVEHELRNWKGLLDRFDNVRVRGPQSRETLEAYGVGAAVTGDPALLIPRWTTAVDPKTVGLNIGISEDSHGNAASDPLELMREISSSIVGGGYTVMLLPTTSDDFALCRQFMSTSPPGVVLNRRMLDFHEFSVAVSACCFVVGMKLHSLVIAASQGVPSICLEYRPKCLDFMRSIGFENYTMRLDAIDIPQLQAWFSEYESERGRLSQKLDHAVQAQRQSLLAVAHAERASLLQTGHSSGTA